jgi:hypothetical protein
MHAAPLGTAAFVGLLVAWGSCLIFVPLGLPLLAVVIAWMLLRGQRKKGLAVALASPFIAIPVYSVGAAAFGYATGRAEILTMGLPSYEAGTPDEETGQPMRSTGCVLTGLEVLHNVPNNLTLRLLSRLLGDGTGVHSVAPSKAQRLRAAAEVWRADHSGTDRCPTPQTLTDDHALASASSITDRWGQPVHIRCTDEETFVVSSGRDRIAGTADDVIVP